MDLSQIKNFIISFVNGQTINEPIENIQELYNMIKIYGIEYLAKITFYFYNNNYNLVLKNNLKYINNKFIVEFYNINNENIQTTSITYEEKIKNFQTVINILQNNNFNNILIPFIINPFNH